MDKKYLATSADVQGLIAQGRTAIETIEIARDATKKLRTPTYHFPTTIIK